MKRTLMIASVLIAAGCAGTGEEDGAVERGSQNFVVGNWPKLPLKGHLVIDFRGPNLPGPGAARDQLRDQIVDGIQRWARPTRIFGANPVITTEATYCSEKAIPPFPGSNECGHWDSYFDEEIRRVVKEWIERSPSMYVEVLPQPMGRSRYFTTTRTMSLDPSASSRVILHELGHAFGLGDTYEETTGFPCDMEHGIFPPTSTSVMCNANFDDPQTDDIAGITHLYCVAYPQDCD